ncbi:MAG TPA: metallophosphoesterase [Bryobacteraceae bacterium]|nr:metallophosphoesterase [Bryobacteraceae bacterium]
MSRLHVFPGLVVLSMGLGLQLILALCLLRAKWRRPLVLGGSAAVAIFLCFTYLLEFSRVRQQFPPQLVIGVFVVALFWVSWMIGLIPGQIVWRQAAFRPHRRTFLRTTSLALCAAPVAVFGFGVIHRDDFQLVETDLPVKGLPKDLQGLRLLQMTDIHLSLFLSETALARAIDMANSARADLVLVTGDLISTRGDPLDACLHQLARLRSPRGPILGCLGNHEIYAGTQDYTSMAGRRLGMEFLRSQSRLLRFGDASINFVGVDYQPMHREYLTGVEQLIVPGTLNVLLSHNPDVFPVAAAKGFRVTLSGHTHGGQVNVEILHRNVNPARLLTPYTIGLYQQGDASIYVSRGIGTIGVPARVGAPPEITVLRLCGT